MDHIHMPVHSSVITTLGMCYSPAFLPAPSKRRSIANYSPPNNIYIFWHWIVLGNSLILVVNFLCNKNRCKCGIAVNDYFAFIFLRGVLAALLAGIGRSAARKYARPRALAARGHGLSAGQPRTPPDQINAAPFNDLADGMVPAQ